MHHLHKKIHAHDLHYTVYLTIFYSCVVVFLLGMVITKALFGTGLDYFKNLAERNLSAAQTRAAIITFDPSAAPTLMMQSDDADSVLGGGADVLPGVPVQGLYRVTFSGVIANLGGGILFFDQSVRPGTPVSGMYYFTTDVADELPDHPSIGHYRILNQLYSVTAGNYTFSTGRFDIGTYDIWVYDEVGDSQNRDQISVLTENVYVRRTPIDPNLTPPVRSMNLDLPYHYSRLSSDALPTNVWPDSLIGPTLQVSPQLGADFTARIDPNSVVITRIGDLPAPSTMDNPQALESITSDERLLDSEAQHVNPDAFKECKEKCDTRYDLCLVKAAFLGGRDAARRQSYRDECETEKTACDKDCTKRFNTKHKKVAPVSPN